MIADADQLDAVAPVGRRGRGEPRLEEPHGLVVGVADATPRNAPRGSAVESCGALFQARSTAMNAAISAAAADRPARSSRRASTSTAMAAAVKTIAVATGTSAGPTPTTE